VLEVVPELRVVYVEGKEILDEKKKDFNGSDPIKKCWFFNCDTRVTGMAAPLAPPKVVCF
jgi:hypothetical protein